MATLVNTGTQATVTAANSITVNSPSASASNTLVLLVSWVDVASSSAQTLTAPAGWSVAYNPTGAFNNHSSGFAVFYKTAAGGIESPVINEPTGANLNLYANGIITEWSGMGAFDSAASATSVDTFNTAASSTGRTVPNTGTLAASSSTVFTGASIFSGTGLANCAIAFSGGGWTQEAIDVDTTASVGTLFGHKLVATTTALGAVYTWTSDATQFTSQEAIVVFSDAGTATVGSMMMMGA